MRKSIIITSFNRSHLFVNTWESLKDQLNRNDELVVIEEGEDRGWIPLLNTLHFPFQYVKTFNTEYRGGGVAKNIALKLAKNPMIVINDPEVYQLDACITEFEKYLKAQPRAFLVPGTLYSGRWENDEPASDNVMKFSQAPFSAGVMKKELMEVGGWDERYIYWGNDDNDLMNRLGKNGCKHVVLQDLRIFHQWHQRPPQKAIEDANESLLYEKNTKTIANQGIQWGRMRSWYEYQTNYG